MPKISGTYKITCIPTKKFYIGSSKNITKRFGRHKNELRRGIHPNRYLQSAWNKYKENNFSFEVIEMLPADLLLVAEQSLLDTTRCFERNIGFNLSSVAESTKGVKFSLKSRKNKSKKWIVTNPQEKEFIITNLSNFCRKNSLSSSLMVAVAQGKRPHHKNWKCRPIGMSFEEWNNKILSLKKNNGNNKEWIVTNPQGNEILTNNLTIFCQENNLNNINMYHVACKYQAHHKNWLCRPASISLVEWSKLPKLRKN